MPGAISGCACHPSTGGEYHPVRLRLPPLHKRGIVCPYGYCEFSDYWQDTTPSGCACHHPRHHSVRLQEGNILPIDYARHLPRCHPSTGGEYSAPTVIVNLVIMQDTTPSGCAPLHRKGIGCDGYCEFSDYARHHPVRLRLPPFLPLRLL